MAPRRSRGAAHVPGKGASPHARRAAAILLEVLAGVRSTADGAKALEVSLTRYYMLEHRALEALVAGCEPRRRGPGQDAGRQVERLTAKVGQLERELRRHQALIRAARRASGLGEPAKQKAAPVSEGGKRRRQEKPRVRALRRAKQLKTLDKSLGEGTIPDQPTPSS